ncbi:MAG: methyltransferase domain-containing protein [Evtepia sp.]
MTQKHEPFGNLPLGEEETYDALAACYDDMTADVDYPAWADFIEALFAGSPVRSMGAFHRSWTWPAAQAPCLLLAERGYEVIGVGFSPEMLAVAAEKSLEGDGEAPIFLCQSMEELDLYGTVDACVCLLDSVNHVTEPDRLQQALHRVLAVLRGRGPLCLRCPHPRALAEPGRRLVFG